MLLSAFSLNYVPQGMRITWWEAQVWEFVLVAISYQKMAAGDYKLAKLRVATLAAVQLTTESPFTAILTLLWYYITTCSLVLAERHQINNNYNMQYI